MAFLMNRKNDSKKVSFLTIIIPVYNVERYLPMCLNSVICQGLEDYEVVLVNDGSTDESGNICDEYASKHSNFSVIHQENMGVAAARNCGIAEAKGEYLMFLDSDDFLVPNTIAPLLKLAQQKHLDVIGFSYEEVSEDAVELSRERLEDSKKIEIFKGVEYIAHHNYPAQVWWYLVRRELLVSNGLTMPVGHVLEEAAFNMRLFLCAERIAQVPDVIYCYRNRINSIMRNSNKGHCIKMLSEYLYAANDINDVLANNRDLLDDESFERCRSRRDSYVFFGAIRALKLGKDKEYFAISKKESLYPFKRMSKTDYPGAKYSILHWLMHHACLWYNLGTIYRFFK